MTHALEALPWRYNLLKFNDYHPADMTRRQASERMKDNVERNKQELTDTYGTK